MAKLPAPVVVPQSRQRDRPGLGENVLLSLASAAPDLLTMFLDRQQQGKDRAQQEQQAQVFLQGIAGSPDLLTDPIQQALLSAGAGIQQAPTATGAQLGGAARQLSPPSLPPRSVDVSTIQDPVGTAGGLMQLFEAQSQAGQRAGVEAQTQTVLKGEERTAAQAPLLQERITLENAGLKLTNELNDEFSRIDRELGQDLATTDINLRDQQRNSAIFSDQIALDRLATAEYTDAVARASQIAQLFVSADQSAEDGLAAGAQAAFRSDKIPLKREFVSDLVNELTVDGIVSGQQSITESLSRTTGSETAGSTFATEALGFSPEEYNEVKTNADALILGNPTAENVRAAFDQQSADILSAIELGAIDSLTGAPIQQVTIEQLSALYTFLFPTFWKADVAVEAIGGRWQALGNFLKAKLTDTSGLLP